MAVNVAVTVVEQNGDRQELDWSSMRYCAVAAVTRIVIGVLRTRDAEEAMVDVALAFDDAQHYTWYGGLRGSRQRATGLVRVFLDHIFDRFPVINLDKRITDPLDYAVHIKLLWNPDRPFDPRQQSVDLNYRVSSSVFAKGLVES